MSKRPRIHPPDPAPAPELPEELRGRKRKGRNRKRSKLLEGELTRDGGVAVLVESDHGRVLVVHPLPTRRVGLCPLSVGKP